VSDVIGGPEAWPNSYWGEPAGRPEMRGARISDVIASGSEIAIQTTGGPAGATFSVFEVKDPEIRKRILHALKIGTDVYKAAATVI
jgi:hypothetical protein